MYLRLPSCLLIYGRELFWKGRFEIWKLDGGMLRSYTGTMTEYIYSGLDGSKIRISFYATGILDFGVELWQTHFFTEERI